MEIQALKLFVPEADVHELLKKAVAEDDSVEDLRARVTPEGVVVEGTYRVMLPVSFETLWELSGEGPELVARLASVKVSGFSANLLKGVLLKMARDAVADEPGVRVGDDAVRVHLEEAARARGVPLQVRLTAVRCSIRCLVVEAG